MTTQTEILKALKAIIIAAAAPLDIIVEIGPAEPVDLDAADLTAGAFAVSLETQGAVPRDTVGNCAPFYFDLNISLELIAIADASVLRDRFDNLARRIDAGMMADWSLGGRIKGMRWSLNGVAVEDINGAAPECVGEITIAMEFESGNRLAV